MTVSYFFLVSRIAKLYETGYWFAEFRSFSETEKYENTKKVFQAVSRNWKNCFVSQFCIFPFKLCTFSSNFKPFIRVSYLLFECRTFYSRKFRTFLNHQWRYPSIGRFSHNLHSRIGGMQERRDSGLEGFRTRGIQERRDSGLEGYRKGGIQD